MSKRLIGILLVIIGIVMIAYTGINYVTKDKIVDVGPIEVSKEQNHSFEWSPVVGGVLLLVGIVVVVADKKKIA